MRYKLPPGHNHTTQRFSRVSKGVDYAYSAYRPVKPLIPSPVVAILIILLALMVVGMAHPIKY